MKMKSERWSVIRVKHYPITLLTSNVSLNAKLTKPIGIHVACLPMTCAEVLTWEAFDWNDNRLLSVCPFVAVRAKTD